MTEDANVVAESTTEFNEGSLIELNEDKTMVRRIKPFEKLILEQI